MGICESTKNQLQNEKPPLNNNNLNIKLELYDSHKPIPLETANELSKSICKIIYKINNQEKYGTGFFMIYKSLKCLISNYHVISSDLLNKVIEIEIYNKKIINLILDKNKRYIKLFKQPIDMSIIEIKDSDGINQDIEFLNYDLNCERGYSQYINQDIICIGYPFGEKVSYGSGKIININNFEFEHNSPTKVGSSGSPVIIFQTKQVIGIHKQGDLEKNKYWNIHWKRNI